MVLWIYHNIFFSPKWRSWLMWLGNLAWNELIEIVESSLSSKYKCKPGVTFNLNNRKKTLAINLTPSNRLVRRFETKKARHHLHILFIRICIVYSCIVYKFMVNSNGGKGRIPIPNRMNFWKSAKGVGEGGGHFQSQNLSCRFGNFKQGFLSMKLIKRRVISGFRVCFVNNCIDINWYQLMLTDINWYYLAYASLYKCDHIQYRKLQHNFSKLRGGVKGRLDFFQQFIRFSSGILP